MESESQRNISLTLNIRHTQGKAGQGRGCDCGQRGANFALANEGENSLTKAPLMIQILQHGMYVLPSPPCFTLDSAIQISAPVMTQGFRKKASAWEHPQRPMQFGFDITTLRALDIKLTRLPSYGRKQTSILGGFRWRWKGYSSFLQHYVVGWQAVGLLGVLSWRSFLHKAHPVPCCTPRHKPSDAWSCSEMSATSCGTGRCASGAIHLRMVTMSRKQVDENSRPWPNNWKINIAGATVVEDKHCKPLHRFMYTTHSTAGTGHWAKVGKIHTLVLTSFWKTLTF